MSKFESRVKRLAEKIGQSKTPVPGIIMGLSGTDSIAAFLVCYEAMEQHDKGHRMYGVHYVNANRRKPTWFEENIIPWLRDRCPNAEIHVEVPFGNLNIEDMRFADINLRSRYEFNNGQPTDRQRDDQDHYWLAACINLTERKLGKYTILAKAASLWPVATLWKTDILEICKEQGVPNIAMEMSRLPDCLCGRDELAAENLELIDQILQNNLDWNLVWDTDRDVVEKVYQWVHDIKKLYDFKERTPYLI